MKERGVKAVTFDLWNTLIVDTPEGGRTRAARRIDATHSILGEEGFPFSKEWIADAYSTSQVMFEEVRQKGLDIVFDDQMDMYLDLIVPDLSGSLSPSVKRRITTEHTEAYFKDPPLPMTGALEVLKDLHSRGYKLGLICNSGATPGSLQRQFLANLGVARYLRVLTFSDEEELAKPSPGVFLKTLRALRVSAEAAVHVGDRPETDILGAKEVGMKAVLIGQASLDGVPVEPDAQIELLSELPEVLEQIR
ncbi:MAG: HAD family hydrolase [Dehalococcoidia bacterium]